MSPPARGLTLIEVLVALAIVAITLAAGIKAAGAMSSSSQRLGDTIAAQWCADNQLTELRLQKQFPSVGDSAFACEQLGTAYTGQLQVRPTPNPNFRRVEARISDTQGHFLVSLTTILSRR